MLFRVQVGRAESARPDLDLLVKADNYRLASRWAKAMRDIEFARFIDKVESAVRCSACNTDGAYDEEWGDIICPECNTSLIAPWGVFTFHVVAVKPVELSEGDVIECERNADKALRSVLGNASKPSNSAGVN